MNIDIVQLACDFVKSKNKGRNSEVTPYNVFAAWKMSENDHTKLLLSILRYKDVNGQYTFTSETPLAKMKGNELVTYFTKLYTQDLNYLCRHLIERSSEYM